MKIDELDTMLAAVDLARHILGEYIEPGPQDAASTVQRLLVAFDDKEVIKALDHLKRRQTIRLAQ
jgi:hypothetical protein